MTLKNSQVCRSCSEISQHIFTGTLIGHNVNYFECQSCGYLQTERPYWLEEAYSSPINEGDTGIMMRNQLNAKIVTSTMLMLGKLNGCIVDCAGGYGILVRLLRDFGVNALWSDRYCENILARGFEYSGQQADLVTAFEAFEHFVDPADELDRLLAIAPNLLLSTELIPSPTPKLEKWWYYGQEHGQHIGFFTEKTLQKLAHRRGKFLVSNGSSYHLITSEPVSHKKFKLIFKLSRYLPYLIRNKLKSKTWSDHELIIKKKI